MLVSTRGCYDHYAHECRCSSPFFTRTVLVLIALPLNRAEGQATPGNQQPAAQQQPPEQATPDSGGPSGDTGVIAVPKPSNFRVYEDGVQQKVEGFKRTEAPITALILMEYSARGMGFRIQALNAALAFAQQLRPQDYVAMMTFDLNSHIVSDFTQDKQQLAEGMRMLESEVYMPAAFSESDIFDALNESLDRLDRVQGQKYIFLIATGIDTFSKLTFDKIEKRVKASHDITIFTMSTDGFFEAMTEGQGGMGGAMRDMSYLQADNEMKSFSDWTGGMHFAPRFTGEMPDDVKAINETIRAKYELVYHPTNGKQDGTFRKIRVELVDEEGQPLRMQDEKKKPLKYDIITRDGYRASQEVE
jgi:VWFA-related protein